MLIDERNITITGGRGGDGVVHWHREKYVAKGGPDGGDGGDGGDVYLESVRDIYTLGQYREGAILAAQDGVSGSAALRSGARGSDLTVPVPVGSLAVNLETREQFQFLKEGQRVLVATGGRGGFGNAHFKSSKNTTPKQCTPGEPPQSYRFHITLTIIADVGIVGLPNAGKSTLLNMLTNASARVGAYPFTTLEPNLGVFHGYVLADIPGLLAQASEGKGLGHKFLRHVKQTRTLLHLVAADEPDVGAAYRTVRDELRNYDATLLEKKEIVVLSKIDCVSEDVLEGILAQLPVGAVSLTVLDDASVSSFKEMLSQGVLSEDVQDDGTPAVSGTESV